MAPSLFAQYISELTGGVRKAIEHEWGFVFYTFPAWAPDCIMIEDLYVIPELRFQGKGGELFRAIEDLGRLAGKKYLIAQLEIANVKSHASWAAQLAVGLVPISAENGKILTRKVL